MPPASPQYCQSHLPRQQIPQTLEEAKGGGAGFGRGRQAAFAGTAPLCSALTWSALLHTERESSHLGGSAALTYAALHLLLVTNLNK